MLNRGIVKRTTAPDPGCMVCNAFHSTKAIVIISWVSALWTAGLADLWQFTVNAQCLSICLQPRTPIVYTPLAQLLHEQVWLARHY